MLITNENACRQDYPDELKAILNIEQANQSRAWLAGWNRLNPGPTPLFELPDLAASLGIDQLCVKDESARSELGSFKALGAPVALLHLLLRQFAQRHFDVARLLNGDYRDTLADFTVISATDGNHGRALAAAAQSIGCRCVIVLHANVSHEREAAIAAYGARIVRISGHYDASVEEAARLATANGWWVVSDTSYEGYEDIPRDVMQGYGTIAAEVLEQHRGQPAFTHLLLQGGVGGLAAGIASYFWEHHGQARPRMIVVEPRQADCLLQSAISGRASRTQGSVDSVMAGLACGETSPLAWKFLRPGIDHFLAIEDDEAVDAMRLLARGSRRDTPLIAGESAVAGLAGLIHLLKSPALKDEVGLDRHSRVLLISTEGATAPSVYQALVGETAQSVARRQREWTLRQAT
ncbi:diaminopropionate ammonia-lyase [Pseudomonas gingeri]|uniref:Diaminopropionate ammonia-lyase n=1 Tax=Pseudomonas gingeri TaxID=117681 RepID=A0A7Y8CJP2_9PSED|nr:diaminopropionate ammonia-lyase [Pseudomonas gingeri]NWB25548.1 diaminopropionate ammonia-lyase [Pseudomonas gingeri]NWC33262.1 diaminopropionate ammonia-lyase [Pseudomonas gingeri]